MRQRPLHLHRKRWIVSDYIQGFHAGISEAARAMREAAREHTEQCAATKNIVEAQGHQFAATVLASYANGLLINASVAFPDKADNQALIFAAQSVLRFLRNQDGAGFGTTKMEGSEFHMWASTLANDLQEALGT